MTKDVLN